MNVARIGALFGAISDFSRGPTQHFLFILHLEMPRVDVIPCGTRAPVALLIKRRITLVINPVHGMNLDDSFICIELIIFGRSLFAIISFKNEKLSLIIRSRNEREISFFITFSLKSIDLPQG